MRFRLNLAALLCLTYLLPALGCSSEASSVDPVTASIDGGSKRPETDRTEDLSPQKRTAARPQIDPLHPVVEIDTTLGKITAELDAELAPGTVRNFLNYALSGHYDQTIFHYVSPESIVLGGGYTADFQERPTLSPIRNEAHNGLKNKSGTIAMSRQFDSIDSASAQFFFNVVDNPNLDHQSEETAEQYGYCVFGKITSGMDVVERIARTPVHESGEFVNSPETPVLINSVRVVR